MQMERKSVGRRNEAKAAEMLLMAWGFVDADKDAAARIARRASGNGTAWVLIQAARIFAHLGRRYREDEIRCLKMAAKLAGEGEAFL